MSNWQVVVPSQDQLRIEDMDMLHDYMVLFEKNSGMSQIRVIRIDENHRVTCNNGGSFIVNLPEAICSVEPGINNVCWQKIVLMLITNIDMIYTRI